jgi:hypothetical protein
VHDFWHVLCGVHPTVVGEIAVKWFEMVQTKLPVATLSAFAGPLRLPPAELRELLTVCVSLTPSLRSSLLSLVSAPQSSILCPPPPPPSPPRTLARLHGRTHARTHRTARTAPHRTARPENALTRQQQRQQQQQQQQQHKSALTHSRTHARNCKFCSYVPWAARAGANAVFLMNVPYEQHLETNITDLRAALRLEPFDGRAYYDAPSAAVDGVDGGGGDDATSTRMNGNKEY